MTKWTSQLSTWIMTTEHATPKFQTTSDVTAWIRTVHRMFDEAGFGDATVADVIRLAKIGRAAREAGQS